METWGQFVILCTLQFIHGMRGSALLDSLTCVNNYKTHWKCNWKVSAEAHELLPMNLIYRSDLISNGNRQCEPQNSIKMKDGEVYMSCQINETFIYAMNTTYHFEPKRDVSRDTYVIPNSHVRMPPPEEVMVQKYGSNDSSIILRWRMPEHFHSDNLQYQVTYYRKDWESWEDAALLNVMGKTELRFSPQRFVPGSTYLFRVRCVPDKDQLYRSAWSDSITWTMPEEADGAVPQNLHCEYDGFTLVKCSWEVRKELSSLSYMLYYEDGARNGSTKTSNHGEKPCNNPSRQMRYGTPYVFYSCSFQIPSSQAHHSFHIQVRPQEKMKIFKPSKHIQTDPPTNLKIKDLINYKYKLGWSPPAVAYSTIKLTYQLCFWKQGDEDCSGLSLVNVSGNVPEYYIPSSKLSSSTNYTAKVRAKPDNGPGFNGPWSSWSQSHSWKTDRDVDTVAIIVSTFFACVGVLIFVYLCFIFFKRWKEQWENSIPDPRKSKLGKLQLGYQDPNFSQFISSDFCLEVEQPLVSLQISILESPHSTCHVSENIAVEMPSKPSVSPLGPYSMAPPTAGKVQDHQHSSKLPDTEGTKDLKGESISHPTVNLSRMGHKSPYFIFTSTQSMSDFIAKETKSSDNITQSKGLSLPKEVIPSCQTISPANKMSYVLNMEAQPPLQTPLKDNGNKHESKKSSYFTFPLTADVQVSHEGPLMIVNPDETGPLVLKQVGDYCFFPGIRGSQENLERKMVPASAKLHPQVSKDAALSAVQAVKVMQGDYLALPLN